MRKLSFILLAATLIATTAYAGGSLFKNKHKTANTNGVYSIGVHICSSLECPPVRIVSGKCDGPNMEKRWGVCVCESGYVAKDGGCVACPEGEYSDGIHGCTGCETGTYKENEGDSSCSPCPEGSYCVGGKRCECPEHATCDATGFACNEGFTTTPTSCTCPSGKYIDSENVCRDCPNPPSCGDNTCCELEGEKDACGRKMPINKADRTYCKTDPNLTDYDGYCSDGVCVSAVKEVCDWSDWYDTNQPQPGTDGGDFESFEDVRQRGYQICSHPQDIECQAQLLPGISLEKLGQVVTCDLNTGLVCHNSEQTPPLCLNYKFRFFCCEKVNDLCGEGYYPGETACLPCPNVGVKSCGKDGLICRDGYYNNGHECLPCPVGSKSCDKDGLICQAGYYNNGHECLPCDGENEYSLEGAIECSICEGNVSDDHTACLADETIINCPEHAAACDSNGEVTACEKGYVLSNGMCYDCPEHASCIDGKTFTCTNGYTEEYGFCVCLKGYYLNEDICVKCPTEHVDSCDERGLNCEEGYTPDMTILGYGMTQECVEDMNYKYYRCTSSGHGTWGIDDSGMPACICDMYASGTYCEEVCEPHCHWTEWFDVDYPKNEEYGGDIETYEKIRNKGYTICNQPQEIECEAENYPGLTPEQIGQQVHCDIRFGLVCHNDEQLGLFKMCYNYRMRVLCCDYSHCENNN